MNEIKFLKPAEVVQRTRMPKTVLYERVKKGEFMRPIKMGCRASFWPEHELATWQRAVMAGASVERLKALVAELEAQRKGASDNAETKREAS